MKKMEVTDIWEIQSELIRDWDDSGKAVCKLAYYADKFSGSFEKFLTHCTHCGGNWGGLLLSGIRELYPEIYEAIPEKMGRNAFADLIHLLRLLGVEFDEEKKDA